jgi:hypothetical protein
VSKLSLADAIIRRINHSKYGMSRYGLDLENSDFTILLSYESLLELKNDPSTHYYFEPIKSPDKPETFFGARLIPTDRAEQVQVMMEPRYLEPVERRIVS